MHQHHRPPPVTASPAKSPRTNPTRTNNPREGDPPRSRPGSARGNPNEQAVDMSEGSDALMRGQGGSDQGKDAIQKLSQVVQNYFTKAAHVILHSRVSLPPAYHKGTDNKRVNKWFNTELDETEITRDDLRLWKTSNATTSRPPAMILEIFIDTQDLTNNQSLAIIDDQGRRWDVEEALTSSLGASGEGQRGQSKPEVVVERWQIQLGEPSKDSSKDSSKDLSVILPRVYKNSIVLFRSLLAFAKLLPAWNLAKKTFKSRSTAHTPKLKYRIIEASQFQRPSNIDPLTVRLFDGSLGKESALNETVENYPFEPIDSPAGPFSIQVTYRLQCDFRIDDSEALLSSHFMGMDEHFFEPSLGCDRGTDQLEKRNRTEGAGAGSLPQHKQDRIERSGQSQAYGSMSTFHQTGPPTGSSPLSALRAARDRASQSPPEVPRSKAPPSNRLSQGSRSSLRSSDGPPAMGRRPSVSFMPFKTPSLSASPSQGYQASHGEQAGTSLPRGSLGRISGLSSLAEARIPSTLGPQGLVPARGSPSASEQAPASSSSNSPKPSISKYSSSFGHRKAKLSVGGASKNEEDNNSSGKASVTSSNAQPGSGILAEGGGASSGSIPTDDDSISDFLKLLEQKKNLKSFSRPGDQSAAESSTRRTNAALNRFRRMGDSNQVLSESILSSLVMHRSSSSSSRQLSSVPPMVAGTSISTSSSPGKPISPHTPHTPAIPSRLSANSIIEYPHRRPSNDERLEEEPDGGDPRREGTYWDPSVAIDIPTFPRPFHLNDRRSNSVEDETRAGRARPADDDSPFGQRSASLGGRPQLSSSALLRLQENAVGAHRNPLTDDQPFRPPPGALDGGNSSPRTYQRSNEENTGSQPSYRAGPYRPRIGHVRGQTPGGSISSLDRVSPSSGSIDQPGSSRGGGGRYSHSRPPNLPDEDEQFLFAMSDIGTSQQQHDRKGSEGGPDSSHSSRRESRRGGFEGQGHQARGW
ncbi:MAG: hypothetical protein LQ352_005972 [Teloschistes flavicans]|nr:MAG: hypothetical protein LQ352_005972 [Teloschistes flavicans]